MNQKVHSVIVPVTFDGTGTTQKLTALGTKMKDYSIKEIYVSNPNDVEKNIDGGDNLQLAGINNGYLVLQDGNQTILQYSLSTIIQHQEATGRGLILDKPLNGESINWGQSLIKVLGGINVQGKSIQFLFIVS